MINGSDYLLQCLVDEGFVEQAVADAAVVAARSAGIPPHEHLLSTGTICQREVAIARAILCESPFVNLEHYDIDLEIATRLPRHLAEAHGVLLLFELNGVLTLGMVDPMDLRALDQVRGQLAGQVETVLCEEEALRGLIRRAYTLTGGTNTKLGERDRADADREATLSEEPIVAAVNQILDRAIEEEASDVHISPCEHELQLRYRVDGRLQRRQGPDLSAHAGLIQRLKVMAKLDLTQSRRPQDGKFRFTHKGERYEVRLSTIPTVVGENAVMRILRPNASIRSYAELGMPDQMASRLERMLDHPHGMLLVTGPTGSGKTSTLYTAVKQLNSPDVNIMTIEDPVEIRLKGIRQVQTNAEIGMTFAGALRSMLRQDPDIVLVGEIRDSETALIATQASLTGHLVLSTLHTNDAPSAVARLIDLGVAPFVVNSSLLGVAAQRLVRQVCTSCVEDDQPDARLLKRVGVTDTTGLRRGAGCSACAGSGFRGRTGIYELMRMTNEVADLVERGVPTKVLVDHLASDAATPDSQHYGPMWVDGTRKARLGLTTLAEVARVAAIGSLDAVAEIRAAA